MSLFFCFFFNRKPLKQAKAERPQVNKSFAVLMINSLSLSLYIYIYIINIYNALCNAYLPSCIYLYLMYPHGLYSLLEF